MSKNVIDKALVQGDNLAGRELVLDLSAGDGTKGLA